MTRADLIDANREFARSFGHGALPRRPRRRLAVVTCMDARLEPLASLGLELGDANVIRNAGAVVSQDVIRSLVVSNLMLETREALVIGHTQCGMVDFTNAHIRERLAREHGADADALDFYPFEDVSETVADGVQAIEGSPLLRFDDVAGFVYDVESGLLERVA